MMRRVFPLVAFLLAAGAGIPLAAGELAAGKSTPGGSTAGGSRALAGPHTEGPHTEGPHTERGHRPRSDAERAVAQAFLQEDELLTFRGQTMGTTYVAKVHGRPWQDATNATGDAWAADVASAIDRELRRINDQMSTYLKSSEISRFNGSESTDWLSVSAETAEVVQFAQSVSEQTDGAFDVTVGPLVDRWSFGAGERHRDVPTAEELAALQTRVGYRRLHVRTEPPALRKDIAELQIDLSAIAKGHGVDRIVDLLTRRGAANVFVEIGGEVRVTGDKQGQPWVVGVQHPDASAGSVLVVAQELADEAMATSGDYRNFFEVDGVRYSHTIDPRTARPVRHDLASASVIAPSCMAADAWATAFVVLGMERSRSLAESLGLSTLLIQRSGESFELAGVGAMAEVADAMPTLPSAQVGDAASAGEGEPHEPAESTSFARQLLPVAILAMIGLGAVVLAMAVGVIFGRHSISGSCGGLNAQTNPDGSTQCSLCSNPSDACKDLRERMQAEQRVDHGERTGV